MPHNNMADVQQAYAIIDRRDLDVLRPRA